MNDPMLIEDAALVTGVHELCIRLWITRGWVGNHGSPESPMVNPDDVQRMKLGGIAEDLLQESA